MSTKLTGDVSNFKAVQKEGVTLHNIPHVVKAHLADKSHNVNIFSQSGKRLGAQLVAIDGENAAILAASGSEPTDAWVVVADLKGTVAAITPA